MHESQDCPLGTGLDAFGACSPVICPLNAPAEEVGKSRLLCPADTERYEGNDPDEDPCVDCPSNRVSFGGGTKCTPCRGCLTANSEQKKCHVTTTEAMERGCGTGNVQRVLQVHFLQICFQEANLPATLSVQKLVIVFNWLRCFYYEK